MRKSNSSSGTWAEIYGDLGDVTKGEPGKSAYEIAVEHGFEGTEEEWLSYVQANADRAVSASTAALEAKEAAQYASDEAQGHAESASTSAGVAHSEAEAAAESAARAEAAAVSAGESRDGAAMSAEDAADSATAAAASATEAASQALLATGRADEARQSQIDAHTSEVHIEEMYVDIMRAPVVVEEQTRQAIASAQAAAQSATAAAGSATASANSATASAGSASESASSASDSADSASAAAASATAAAGSATAAAGSATQAEAAVTRAVSEAVTAAQTAVQSQLDSKLDVNGKAVDSAHADDADTVNNHTVLSDVPANAVFTDTTYQQMTDQELEDGISTQGRVVAANTIATFILNVIADVINSAPAALDTLEELAAAINDDPDFHVTVMNEIGKKLDKAGGVVTGDLTVNGTLTADVTGNAATATKATGDKNGSDIAATYLPVAGGLVHGPLEITGKELKVHDTDTASQLRLWHVGTNPAIILRNDGSNFYILVTSANTSANPPATADWTNERPLTISCSTGVCNINGNAATATKINGKTIPVVSSFNSTTGVLALTSLS